MRVPGQSYDFIISPSNPGEKLKPVYKGSYAPDGSIRLTKVDEIDIQSEIQSHLYQTDMQYIVNRLLNGDTSVLNNQSPVFGDFTTFPKSYSECIQKVIDAENMFATLPQDVRDQFGNDWAKWLSQTGTEKWLTAMGIELPSTVVPDVSREKLVSEVISDAAALEGN